MLFARLTRSTLSGVLLVAAMALAACAPVPSATTGSSPLQTPSEDVTELPTAAVPVAAIAAQQELATQLGIDPTEIQVVAVEPVTWPDSCLGVVQPGIECAQALVPGYRVIVEAQGQQYEFHTSQSGDAVIRAPGVESAPTEVAAVGAAKNALALQIGADLDQISVVSVQEVEWRDSCLGLGGPAEACMQAVTPGYLIVLEALGVRYEIHTNATGSAVRIAPSAQAEDTQAAATAAQQTLAAQLGANLRDITVVSFEPMQWTDSCLGLGGPAESCLQAATPGYRFVFEVGGTQYEVRTDATGSNVRIAPATGQPQTGETPTNGVPSPGGASTDGTSAEALIAWQALDVQAGCQAARVYTGAVQYGPCGGDLQTGQLATDTERPSQLADLIKTYAPFSAVIVAGKLDFAGQGRITATPAEQRMIAEWTSQAAQEAAARTRAATGLILTWHREGGIAGFCDDLTIYATGYAYASDCKGSVIDLLGSRRLTADELDKLYGWYDRLQSFRHEQKDAAAADAMTIRILFNGQGQDAATGQDYAAINEYAAQVLARWAEPTPVPTVQAQADVMIYTGPAETYPTAGQVAAGQSALVTGVNRDSTWWRVICPDDTLGNCWVSADASQTTPNVPPGATGLAPLDETAIYAAVARRVYTVDHTFGAAPNFPRIYLLRAENSMPGAGPAGDAVPALAPVIRKAIVAALSDLPAQFTWVNSMDDVPRDQNGSVADGAAIITLGNIEPQPDGTLHVPAGIYIGMLAAGGQTYVLEQVDGEWQITGNTGSVWIS
jgi:hypothetical protein